MPLIRNITAILLAALLAVSCSDRSEFDAPDVPGGNGSADGVYLDLSIYFNNASRGGETHPDEASVRQESELNNITLFFINHADGLQAPDNTEFAYRRYFDVSQLTFDSNGHVDQIFMLEGYTPKAGDRVIAVANMGNLTLLSTLGQLRNYQEAAAWQGDTDPMRFYNFAMSSSSPDDGRIYERNDLVDGVGTVNNPYRASLSIERLAARIDFGFDGINVNSDKSALTYQVLGSDESTVVGRTDITHIIPVNVMQLPTYAIKHVTTGFTEDFSCFSTLSYNQNERSTAVRPTAYVVDPRTSSKTTTATVPSTWYGSTAASSMTEASFTDKYKVSSALNDVRNYGTCLSAGFEKSFTLAYANENTVHKTASTNKYLTGLLIKAVYTPAAVYASAAEAVAETPSTPNADGTFYRYRPVGQTMSEENCVYFTTPEAAKDYADLTKAVQYDIIPYDKGECYYRVWIRHVVDNTGTTPHEPFEMEYGIVRNHIYRVGVSFSGPGSPDITIDDPDTVDLIIFVRKWNLRTLDHILM